MKKTTEGQTLIEALVTILVIAVAVIALVRFQTNLAYNNSLAQQRAEATLFATRQIEILRDYQVLNNTTGFTSYNSIASGTSTVTGANTTYNLSWTVTNFTNPTYKTIDLTASWTDRNNTAQSIRLVTDVAGIEPSNTAAVM